MNASILKFYRGKRVFITGHTGFKGSWLSAILLYAGAEVNGYALEPTTDPNLFDMLGLDRKMDFQIGDVRDYEKLFQAMSRAKPEIVFHLAAQPLVRLSYKEPIETFGTNVMGTLHVLEAMRHISQIKAGVIVTTDKVYENLEQAEGYVEADRLGGSDPYAASKSCAEIVTQSYWTSFFKGQPNKGYIATARAGNVIGGGDFAADRILPDCIRFARRGQPIALRNSHSIRPWQHVLEPLAGYLMLAQKLAGRDSVCCGAFNFGPDDAGDVTTGALADMFCRAWGETATWINVGNANAPHETNYLRLNNAKAKQMLGWLPKLSVDQAVQLTIAWEKASGDKWDITQGQLEAYFK